MKTVIWVVLAAMAGAAVPTGLMHHLNAYESRRETEGMLRSSEWEWERASARANKMTGIVWEVFNEDLTDKILMNMRVTATAYSASAQECNSEPWLTTSMTLSRVGVIAVSRDLEAMGLTMGKTIIIEGMGAFRIEDRMNARWVQRIDILHGNQKAASLFGIRSVTIKWLQGGSTSENKQGYSGIIEKWENEEHDLINSAGVPREDET